ncbi:MAG: bis(5'-nucleosyl)-tetraphosphatase (symmetrical) YqeK [Lachnospiraceae bacterium]
MKLKQADIGKIRKAMEKTLDTKRYEHTLGVAYTASCLAMCYDENIRNAELAGLLHDCAKCIPNEKKIKICEKHNILINEIEYKNPFLLHAKVGSFLAMEMYGVRDKDVINAILNHTTGRPGMTTLEKIIYIADYIEPNRKQAPNLAEIRKLAFQDLDKALLRILEDTLCYLGSLNNDIDPMTKKTYEYYKEQ